MFSSTYWEDWMSGDWGQATSGIEWSMVTGNADPRGRNMMITAAKAGSTDWMGEFKDGFHATQASPFVNANFDACATENQGRLYDIGRAAIGLPPVYGARSKAKIVRKISKAKTPPAKAKKKKTAEKNKKK
jgi:hypothetical protein